MNYLVLLLPITLFGISYFYKLKLSKVMGSGKVPRILSARMNTTLFLALGWMSFIILVVLVNEDVLFRV